MSNEWARIIRGRGGEYIIYFDDGREERAGVRGIFRHERRVIRPTVGDLVKVEENSDPLVKYTIVDFAERKNSLIRPSIANIDRLFILFAITEPKLDLFLLDKMLAAALVQKIKPSIIISKIDLLSEDKKKTIIDYLKNYYIFTGLELYFISQVDKYSKCYKIEEDDELSKLLFDPIGLSHLAEDKNEIRSILQERRNRLRARITRQISYSDFLSDIKNNIRGRVASLAGVSGSGKSTLFNKVTGSMYMETQEISNKLEKGKNTTRHIELMPILGGFFADTPGFEKIDIEKIVDDGESLEFAYPDLRDYHLLCKYNGCRHLDEPDCAVSNLSEICGERYKNYRILRQMIDNHKKY